MRRNRSRCMLVIMLLVTTVVLINSINLLANQIDDQELNSQVTRSEVKSDLKRLLRRFEKLLSYLESNQQQVNLDGLFGIRMAQTAISRSSGSKTLKGLQMRVESLAGLVVESAKASTPEYFEMFKNLIDQPFLLNYVSQTKPKVEESLLRSLGLYGNTEFDEPFSDRCYALLLDNTRQECSFSKECFGFFSDPSASGYFLTHQLLYFLIAEHKGCSDIILPNFADYINENTSSRSVLSSFISSVGSDDLEALKNAVLSLFCTKIYQESKSLFDSYSNDAANFERDLFIEQSILCGIMGTEEFLDRKWMNLVFLFQNKNGCFGSGFDYRDEETNGVKRSKRYDAALGNEGCSAHESGLAFAYYAIMIDYHVKLLKL